MIWPIKPKSFRLEENFYVIASIKILPALLFCCIFCLTLPFVSLGNPPATGTGTLIITLEDENDNAPYVFPSVARVCEDAKDINVVVIGGRDKDIHPNADPFKIELGKQPGLEKTWKISRINGKLILRWDRNRHAPNVKHIPAISKPVRGNLQGALTKIIVYLNIVKQN